MRFEATELKLSSRAPAIAPCGSSLGFQVQGLSFALGVSPIRTYRPVNSLA